MGVQLWPGAEEGTRRPLFSGPKDPFPQPEPGASFPWWLFSSRWQAHLSPVLFLTEVIAEIVIKLI